MVAEGKGREGSDRSQVRERFSRRLLLSEPSRYQYSNASALVSKYRIYSTARVLYVVLPQRAHVRVRLAADVDLARAVPLERRAVRLVFVRLRADVVVVEIAERGFAVGDERAPPGRLAYGMAVF